MDIENDEMHQPAEALSVRFGCCLREDTRERTYSRAVKIGGLRQLKKWKQQVPQVTIRLFKPIINTGEGSFGQWNNMTDMETILLAGSRDLAAELNIPRSSLPGRGLILVHKNYESLGDIT